METWREDLAKVLLAGAVLGLTAGAVVWFLERFETERLHGEVRQYLERYDEFRAWLATREAGGGSGGPQA